MARLPPKTAIGPDGGIVFCEGGILDPGWKAAIAMLELEAKLAASDVQLLADEGEIDSDRGIGILARLEACEVAVALLRAQGQKLGLGV